jgi:hypothetical protein
MKKPLLVGLTILGAAACLISSCSGTKSNNQASGGTSNGGETSTGSATSHSDSGTDAGTQCDAKVKYDADGGVIQYGASDPEQSVLLDAGGFYSQSTDLHGYCFTVSDSTDDNLAGGTSTFDPPCGKTGPCFTVASGLCATAQLDQANGSISWGGGIGCNLAQAQSSSSNTFTAVTGKTSMTISVSGCKVPTTLQMQLNVGNPPFDADAGKYGDGYFCKVVTLSSPDSHGVRTATFNLADLRQDCWNPGGAVFDASSMYVTAMQAQVSALAASTSDWDFCISKWTID